jgi:hypothetical protein
MLEQEPAGGALGDAALGPAREDGGGDDARHADKQAVVLLQRRRVGRLDLQLRVRGEQARELDRVEEVGLEDVLGAGAGLADGEDEGQLGTPKELQFGVFCFVVSVMYPSSRGAGPRLDLLVYTTSSHSCSTVLRESTKMPTKFSLFRPSTTYVSFSIVPTLTKALNKMRAAV